MTNKQRVATHEAGHVVAAIQLGIPVLGATIDPARPHFTRDAFRRSRNLALEHLCIICMAGPEAERLFCGEITDDGDKIDVTMAKNYIADGYPEIMRGYQFGRLRDAAASLVRTDWARFRSRRKVFVNSSGMPMIPWRIRS